MRIFFLFFSIVLLTTSATAQIETGNNTVRFEAVDNNANDPTGLELPAIKQPNISNLENKKYNFNTDSDLGKEEEKPFEMNQDDGLLDTPMAKGPKFFEEKKKEEETMARDQVLGEVRTKTGFVRVMFRDHQYVDGDRIRVYVNEDIVQSDISLTASFQGITISLDDGPNIISFQALNQGDSGPNTAELHVYDEEGRIISAKGWNLLTGYKANITVIKE